MGGGRRWRRVGGSAYDPDLDRIFVAIGNASPYDLTEGGRGGGDSPQLFPDILLRGVLEPLGMSSFADVLSESDVQALHGYLVHEAWLEYSARPATASK